jgi:phosphoglycolate phosphatase-like HAD superfamily hydrolase
MSHFLLVFDLDGTLVDSAPDLRAALNQMLRERGCPALSLPRRAEPIRPKQPGHCRASSSSTRPTQSG